jgi:hypothetical protein
MKTTTVYPDAKTAWDVACERPFKPIWTRNGLYFIGDEGDLPYGTIWHELSLNELWKLVTSEAR